MNVWFTSDTHFGHESMISKGWRPQFSSVDEMDQTIIDRWNDTVRPHDQVWHLGDFGMAASWYLFEVLRKLNGDVHLIAGNHDSVWSGNRDAHKRQRDWLDAGFMSVQSFARRKIGGQHVLLCHFPYSGDHTEGDRYEEYRLNNTGLWLIHGHVHNEWKVRGQQINVGVDQWGFTPVALETIADMMKGE